MSSKPAKPIGEYPLADPADLPPLPPQGADGEPAAVADIRSAPEIAVLEFLNPETVRAEVPLQHPFRLEGQEVRVITVRRLAMAEIGRVADRLVELGHFDRYEFYAAMTGLPAAVIRALPDDDGEALLEKLTPFLPRILDAQPPMAMQDPETGTNETGASPSTTRSEAGGAMPSPPRAR